MPFTKDLEADYGIDPTGDIYNAVISITNGDDTITSATALTGEVGSYIAFTTLVPFTNGLDPSEYAAFGSTIASRPDEFTIVLDDTYTGVTIDEEERTIHWAVDDCGPAITSFAADVATWVGGGGTGKVTLTLGEGHFAVMTNTTPSRPFGFAGVTEFELAGVAPTRTRFTNLLGTGSALSPGAPASTWPINDPTDLNGAGLNQYPGIRVATVQAGSNQVQVLNLDQLDWIAVGEWVMMGGFCFQYAGGGAPQNLAFFQHTTITGIDTETGVVTLSDKLRNTYKSTWPCFNNGYYKGSASQDSGGPAALFPLMPEWNKDSKISNLTWDFPNFQAGFNVRIARIHNVKATGKWGIIASQQQYFFITGKCNWEGIGIEIDKLVEFSNLRGLKISTVTFQSPGPNVHKEYNCTHTFKMDGTALRSVINSCTINQFKCGANSFAGTQSISVYDTDVTTFSSNPVTFNAGGSGVDVVYPMTDGVISHPLWQGPLQWAVEGVQLHCRGAYENEGSTFRITDVWTDGGGMRTTKVATTLGSPILVTQEPIPEATPGQVLYVSGIGAGGSALITTVLSVQSDYQITMAANAGVTSVFADSERDVHLGTVFYQTTLTDWPASDGVLGVGVHPCPIWNSAGNTGDAGFVALNNAAAQNKPLYSYGEVSYTGDFSGVSDNSFTAYGYIETFVVDVSVAYGGADSPLVINPGNSAGVPTIQAGSMVRFNPVYNLRIAGERTTTPASTSGAQTGDSIALGATAWLAAGSQAYFGYDITDEPENWFEMTVKVTTDQQLVVPQRVIATG